MPIINRNIYGTSSDDVLTNNSNAGITSMVGLAGNDTYNINNIRTTYSNIMDTQGFSTLNINNVKGTDLIIYFNIYDYIFNDTPLDDGMIYVIKKGQEQSVIEQERAYYSSSFNRDSIPQSGYVSYYFYGNNNDDMEKTIKNIYAIDTNGVKYSFDIKTYANKVESQIIEILKDTEYYSTDDVLDKGDADITNQVMSVYKNTPINYTITGTVNNDNITSGNGNDVIKSGSGNDTVKGKNGNDKIYGQDGKDNLYGENGNDQIWGGNGNDNIYGGNGNDTLKGEDGNDFIDGGEGNDSLYGQNGNDTIKAGVGNDQIWGNDGNDNIIGEAVNYTIKGGNGNDSIDGGSGNDILYGEAGNDTIKASLGNDTITAGKGNDRIYFQSGNNIAIFANGDGADTVYNGKGSDILKFTSFANADSLKSAISVAKTGNNLILKYTKNDRITITNFFKSGTSAKTLTAKNNETVDLLELLPTKTFSFTGTKDKNNTITGTIYKDNIKGNNKNDNLKGGDGNDTLYGYNGNDKLYGGNGNDLIKGGNGNDSIEGGSGNDRLYGEAGNDKINAATGDDQIWGGKGNDTINAGKGNNKISFAKNDGKDTIISGGGHDTIVFTNEKEANIKARYSGNNVVISYTGGTITLKDYKKGNHSVEYINIGNTQKTIANFISTTSYTNGDDVINYSLGMPKQIRTGNGNDIIKFNLPEGYLSSPYFNVNADGTVADSILHIKTTDANIDVIDYFSKQGTTTITKTDGTTLNLSNLDEVKAAVAGWLTDNGYSDVQTAITGENAEANLTTLMTADYFGALEWNNPVLA